MAAPVDRKRDRFVRRRDDVDRLRTVAAILPTSLVEPVRRLAHRTPSHVVLLRITRITGGIGWVWSTLSRVDIGACPEWVAAIVLT